MQKAQAWLKEAQDFIAKSPIPTIAGEVFIGIVTREIKRIEKIH